MPPRNTFDLHDRLMGGGLTNLLRQWKAEGVTFDEQAHRLRSRGIEVSRETVRRWAKEIEPAATELSAS